MLEKCSWCGTEVEPEDGFRAYEPAGERRAVFCRLEHVIPWSIQGAHWDAGTLTEPVSLDEKATRCSHCDAELTDAHLGTGEVLQDRDRPVRGARGVAHHAGGLRVLLDAPVGEVQARDVHARPDHLTEGLRIAGRGTDGGHDLRTAHVTQPYSATAFGLTLRLNGPTWPRCTSRGRSPRPPWR